MNTRHGKVIAPVVLALMLGSAPLALSAPKHHKKHSRSVYRMRYVDAHIGADVFIGKDREVIRRYFRGHARKLPPGLAMQLRHKGHLPRGLEKRMVVFPVELERRLPPLKAGLVRSVIGGQAVIVNSRSSVILDVFAVF